MTPLILLVTLTLGQYDPVYVPPACTVVVRREPYIYYRIPDREESRFYAEIEYLKKGTVRVPIINNWAPELTEGYLAEGSPYVVFDYRARIPYESVWTPERRKKKEFERYLEEWKAKEAAKKVIVPPPLVKVEPEPLQMSPLPPEPKKVVMPGPVVIEDTRPLAPLPDLSSPLMPLRRPSEVGNADRIITPKYEDR
jgi:hypothetical protein